MNSRNCKLVELKDYDCSTEDSDKSIKRLTKMESQEALEEFLASKENIKREVEERKMNLRHDEVVFAKAIASELCDSKIEDAAKKKEMYLSVVSGNCELDIKEAAIDSALLSIERLEKFKKTLVSIDADTSVVDELLSVNRQSLENIRKIGEKQ